MELAQQHGADVFVCSLHLGDMTGMQLARLLRGGLGLHGMGFLLTTSGSESEDLSDLRTIPTRFSCRSRLTRTSWRRARAKAPDGASAIARDVSVVRSQKS